LVERRRRQHDRRAWEVAITAKGQRTLVRARRLASQVEEMVLRALTADDRRQLLTSCAVHSRQRLLSLNGGRGGVTERHGNRLTERRWGSWPEADGGAPDGPQLTSRTDGPRRHTGSPRPSPRFRRPSCLDTPNPRHARSRRRSRSLGFATKSALPDSRQRARRRGFVRGRHRPILGNMVQADGCCYGTNTPRRRSSTGLGAPVTS
jgi:hypothetical protein